MGVGITQTTADLTSFPPIARLTTHLPCPFSSDHKQLTAPGPLSEVHNSSPLPLSLYESLTSITAPEA